MDCGITFGLNKWVLATSLGLFSLAGYETYKLVCSPIQSSGGSLPQIEPMELKIENVDPEEEPILLKAEEESEPITISLPQEEPSPSSYESKEIVKEVPTPQKTQKWTCGLTLKNKFAQQLLQNWRKEKRSRGKGVVRLCISTPSQKPT